MSVSAALSALLGVQVTIKKVHPLEPFKKTLELERTREVKAAADLQSALIGLVQAVKEKDEHG